MTAMFAGVGDKAYCFVNGKDGWGEIKQLLDGALLVEFPPAKYPLTLVRPTGLYVVPFAQVYSTSHDEPVHANPTN